MFVKFPSIVNIDDAHLYEFETQGIGRWVITEKIDGANFQIDIDCIHHSFSLGSRNQTIANIKDDIYGLYAGKERFNDLVNKTIDFYKGRPVEYVILYGEWFGPKIMNRINYHKDNEYRIFAMKLIVDDKIINITFKQLENFLDYIGYEEFLVPVIDYVHGIEQAKKINNTFVSALSDSHDIAEGFVVCPYDSPSVIRFKSKNNKFKETKPVKIADHSLDQYQTLHNIFIGYLTESRMYSVFSKLGIPKDNKSVPKYLKEFIDDAKKDFGDDNEAFYCIDDKKAIKMITNGGDIPYKLWNIVNKKLTYGK